MNNDKLENITQAFKNLKVGDLVKHKGDGQVYIITEDFGDRKTAVRTVDLTNPLEWEKVYIPQP